MHTTAIKISKWWCGVRRSQESRRLGSDADRDGRRSFPAQLPFPSCEHLPPDEKDLSALICEVQKLGWLGARRQLYRLSRGSDVPLRAHASMLGITVVQVAHP
jgi:hypothetical protein